MVQLDKKMNKEKKLMKFSLFGSALFVVGECIVSFTMHSNAVFIDFVFGCFDLLMMYPFLALIPYLYKPVSEKHPYGYAQVESMFVLIKYIVLFAIIINLIIMNVKDILNGGHLVNADMALVCEIGLGIYEVIIYSILRHGSRNYKSSIIATELYMWKIDIIYIVSISITFAAQVLLQHTSLAFILPYVDSGIAIILSVIFSKEPILQIITNIRELILFAPKDEILEDIRGVVEKSISRYNYDISFLDVIQTGRKVWIEIYVTHRDDIVYVKDFREIQSEVMKDLEEKFDQLYVEIIPELGEKDEINNALLYRKR